MKKLFYSIITTIACFHSYSVNEQVVDKPVQDSPNIGPDKIITTKSRSRRSSSNSRNFQEEEQGVFKMDEELPLYRGGEDSEEDVESFRSKLALELIQLGESRPN